MPPVDDQEQMDYTNQVCAIVTNMVCIASLLYIGAGC